MLSVGRLSSGQEGYYLEQVVAGAEDYYLHAGEVPGRWMGTGAARLGLSGEVSGEDLREVLAGRHRGERLRVTRASVPGFDLTVSAPKSVSVVWGLDSDRAGSVVAGHEAAVDAVVGFVEQEVVKVRRGRNGVEVLPAGGVVAAGFRHRTSRAGDPALHTHVVVANLGEGPDGRWTALDARHLYGQARTAGFVYQAVLRRELVARLGVVWGPVTNGHAELVGVPGVLRDRFSTRRREIDAVLAARGLAGASAAQTAVLTTRSSKPGAQSEEVLRAGWEAVSVGVGWRLATLDRPVGFVVDPVGLAEQLVMSDATFDRSAVVRAVCEQATQGATVVELDTAVSGFLSSEQVVSVGEGRWTTPAMLELERDTVRVAADRRGAGVAVVGTGVLDAVLADRSLGADQVAMVTGLLRDGAGVAVVIGPAGTGKTFALDAARAAWEQAGVRVVGVALAARAAGELTAGAGIEASTIDRFLNRVASGRDGIGRGDVLVVDEAGMVGTRKLARLVQLTAAADAKLVLVGDPRQLPEIDAGGVFRRLSTVVPTVSLTQNRRQRDPVERDAVAALREVRTGDAVTLLESRGRITVEMDSDRLRDRLIDDWWQARTAGVEVLIVATHRVTVDDLNDRARCRLEQAGMLGATVFDTGQVRLAVGEEVVCGRNDRRLGVVNGTRGVVTGGERSGVHVDTGGRSVWLPAGYVAAHVRHGWATTIHKAQGATVDRVFVAVDDTVSLESGYTALTRGRHGNHLYVHHGAARHVGIDDLEVHHDEFDGRDPLEVLAGRLARSRAKTTALEHLQGR
jgi:conjugative relaxase-like TrwC/TraI family protein